MSVDFTKPIATADRAQNLTDTRDTLVATAKLLDDTTPTGVATGMIRWSSTNNKFQKYNGSSWVDLASTFAINVSSFNGQAASYYTNIAARLGYTPVNKAGDTMTGPLVLSADPSATLGAATKGYVDGLTSNLQTQVNAKAPSDAPTFTGVSKFPDGSAAAPSITFSSDTDTGLYRSGTNVLDLVTGGATRWRVDASGFLRNVSNTQPSFCATRSTNLTSGTTVIFDTEVRDVGTVYNNTTGVFNATVAGFYLIAFSVSVFNQTGNSTSVEATLSAGGATIKASDTPANNARGSMSATAVVYMNPSDTTSLTISTLSANLYVLPGSSFSAVLLG